MTIRAASSLGAGNPRNSSSSISGRGFQEHNEQPSINQVSEQVSQQVPGRTQDLFEAPTHGYFQNFEKSQNFLLFCPRVYNTRQMNQFYWRAGKKGSLIISEGLEPPPPLSMDLRNIGHPPVSAPLVSDVKRRKRWERSFQQIHHFSGADSCLLTDSTAVRPWGRAPTRNRGGFTRCEACFSQDASCVTSCVFVQVLMWLHWHCE